MDESRRIYIAGPMTGLPDYNFPAFHAAAERLRQAGWEVINPAENFDGRTDLPRATYLRSDVALLADCDAMAMLEGWTHSRGARLEYLLGRELDLLVIDAMTLEPLADAPTPLIELAGSQTHDEGILEEAQRITSSSRQSDYGHPREDFTRTAQLWTGILAAKLREGARVSAMEVPLCMIAVKLARQAHRHKRDNLVDIEGDVKACFDEISHQAILKVLREKVHDNKFLDLIRRFLKAGVEVEGVVEPTEKGVPQGGVISPLLSNAVLNKLDWFLHSKGTHDNAMVRAAYHRQPNVRFVRYADDWCVFITRASKRYAETLRDQIAEFLGRECGLRLSVEKTHVTHVRDGFDFLGFRLEMSTGRSGRSVPKIKIGPKAKQNLRQRLEEAMRRRPHQESVAVRLQRGSAVVRGWSEYFRVAHNFPAIAGTLDHWAFWTALKAICRKFDIPTGTAMKRYYRGGTIQVDESCRLETFSGIKVKLDYRGPEPYQPGEADYETDDEMEAAFARFNERMRFGNMDVKYRALQRDGYRCRRCGAPVTDLTSHVDHIVPVKRFASFALASSDDNLQTLCLDCHWEKHHA